MLIFKSSLMELCFFVIEKLILHKVLREKFDVTIDITTRL